MSHLVNSRDGAHFTALFTRFEKAGGLQIPVFHGIFDPRCQGFAVDDYGFTLGACWSVAEIPLAGTLKPSGFCNIGADRANVVLVSNHFTPIRLPLILPTSVLIFC